MSIYLVKELSQGQPSNRLDEYITWWLDIFAPCVDYYLEVGDLSFIVFIKKDLDQKGSREMRDLDNFIMIFILDYWECCRMKSFLTASNQNNMFLDGALSTRFVNCLMVKVVLAGNIYSDLYLNIILWETRILY